MLRLRTMGCYLHSPVRLRGAMLKHRNNFLLPCRHVLEMETSLQASHLASLPVVLLSLSIPGLSFTELETHLDQVYIFISGVAESQWLVVINWKIPISNLFPETYCSDRFVVIFPRPS
jgi:uncharacterized protein YybS (DUF2232 family)